MISEPLAVDAVDHPGREGFPESLQQRAEQQHAELGRLEHQRVAHQQGRDQRGEGLVERVVERSHAEHHPQRRPPDLPEDIPGDDETRRDPIQVLHGLDRVLHVIDGTVELLFRILVGLADLPHQQLDDLAFLLTHPVGEIRQGLDAPLDGHGRPGAPALIVGLGGGLQCLQRFLASQFRVAADYDSLAAAFGFQANRR